MSRIAIMQPYTYPYLGYFQLIKSVDTFIFFDDVQFIRRGFINRNSILINERAHSFTIPLEKGSREDLITETFVHKDMYGIWKAKFLKSLELNYKKASQFEPVYVMVENLLNREFTDIASLAKNSILSICNYLNLERNFIDSSSLNYNRSGNGEDKILDICSLLNASTYINPFNGMDLYDDEKFREKGVELLFIKPKLQEYDQGTSSFEKHLSVIDALMWMTPEKILMHLDSYLIIEKLKNES
ncbi:WbqC family protein [Nonlabens marinus]|uniref:WbqC-like protein n=1 Tax=Nonlabens marinus S1-08 TaxID=1454201 RepID=W8VR28_9FLAO|nr:WbqC family protein [Nonlabens marinus]BAO55410.1 hypothetical protein NMS_1401 [Nonlabens marinus S1-08]